MPFFKSRKSTNRRGDSTGFLTYSDAYQLIKENIDEAVEFYELEPAIVSQVFLDPKDFPKKSTPDGGGKMPDYSFLGSLDNALLSRRIVPKSPLQKFRD